MDENCAKRLELAPAGVSAGPCQSASPSSVASQVATLTITPFNSMYFFGFSWTDTRGILPDGSKCFTWSDPQKYYQGHACNGPMWPEFLSTNLGLAYVASNNYAYCGASAS